MCVILPPVWMSEFCPKVHTLACSIVLLPARPEIAFWKCGSQKEVTLQFVPPLHPVGHMHSQPLSTNLHWLSLAHWVSNLKSWWDIVQEDSGQWGEPQINKATSVGPLLFWAGELVALCRGRAAAVTAHLMFALVYFGLKIMYHEAQKPSSTALHRDM